MAKSRRKPKPLRKISADEFARRLRQTVSETDKRFALFLGAGSSVSSGIPDAAGLVRDHWLPRLRDLRAQQRKDLEAWAKEEIAGYDPKNPAASYGVVMEKLFLHPEERQREVEALCDGRFPGFGYATIAALVTLPDGCFNVVLTTNFDDLIADALYLFTQGRPLVIQHESLASFIRPTRTRPLVVKLHGDHRLSPQNTGRETKELKEDIEKQVRSLLHDRGLVLIGYGGDDQGIRSMLEHLPGEALPLGVYWVSAPEPQGPLRPWLEARDAIWVEKGDFDQLMLLIRDVFELPHPDRRRLDKVFEQYTETYKAVSGRISSLPDTAPDAPALKHAVERADHLLPEWWAFMAEGDRLREIEPEQADAVYQRGIEQFPSAALLLSSYAIFLWHDCRDLDRAQEFLQRATASEPRNAYHLVNYASFLQEEREDYARAEEYFVEAIGADPTHAYALQKYAEFLQNVRHDYDRAEEYFLKAIDADPAHAYALQKYAEFLQKVRHDYDRAEQYFLRSVAAAPNNAYLLGDYAFFLEGVRNEYDRAEEYYQRAIASKPDQPYLLGRYAQFLKNIRHDDKRAEGYFRRAQAAENGSDGDKG